MYLLEHLIKGIDGQAAHFYEFYHNLFRHLEDKFFFLFHHLSPKKPPLSGRRRFLVYTAGVLGLRRTQESPPYFLNLPD